jgi:hypothetical protein
MAGRDLRTAMRGAAASTLLFGLFMSDAFAASLTPGVAGVRCSAIASVERSALLCCHAIPTP